MAGAALPDFEIDAQAVSWAQYLEFVRDGGYDEPSNWSAEGWQWVEREAPRHVDQMRQSVLMQRFGKMTRVPMTQPAMHVSWYEADAWCRWAGRRLPTEAEWDEAVKRGRGFTCGDVWEWLADRDAGGRVQRGGAWLTAPRLRAPSARRVRAEAVDAGFSGFRSCTW